MIYVRKGVWETNSSSIHVFTISTNPESELTFPEKLYIRLCKEYYSDYDKSNVQHRFEDIIRFIISSYSNAQVIYRLHKFIEFLKFKTGVEFEWNLESFNDNNYDYDYDDNMVDDILEREDGYEILYSYLTNSKSNIICGSDNYDNWLEELEQDPKIKIIYRQHD